MTLDVVVPLRDNIVLPERPSEDVVATCRELLKMAEAGEIVGLAYVTVQPNGRPTTGWGVEGTSNGFILVGAVARLLYTMNQNQDDLLG